MSARLDTLLVGAAIGFLSGSLGYAAHSWQFWAFAMPLAVWYGFKRGNE